MALKQKKVGEPNRREILKYGLYGSLAPGLASALWLSGCRAERYKKRPWVLLVSVDTLRADHLSCYGYHRNTSGAIDRFAENALLFKNCLSHAPITGSSCASILSGQLPHEVKVVGNNSPPNKPKMLAEILRSVGYKTMAVVSNYVLRKGIGWEQGFKIYDASFGDREQVRRTPERIAEHTTDRAVELLSKFQDEQVFMWVHYQDPHGPYTPPERFCRMFLDHGKTAVNLKLNKTSSGQGGIPRYQKLAGNTDLHYYISQYDGEIRYFDDHFNRLLEALKKMGKFERSLIIFTSDHGEGMGEHDYYFAHGDNLYNILTHVPLIIKFGRELTGIRKDFVQHIDIVPTVLKILGIETKYRFRGDDLRRESSTEREIFAEMISSTNKYETKTSIVLGGLKLIHTPVYKQYELFNLIDDPYEERNLIDDPKYRQRSDDLTARLNRIPKGRLLELRKGSKRRKITNEVKEKLKSLGYVQ
ncbi:MAG TPA: sulfatase [Planctomycetes bacterium]|nr:sulfatase [Planctomycetota bacterium]